MEMNLDRVRANVAAASTEDLLDRATVYRDGMEPEALELIEAELRKRGVTAAQQADHAERYTGVLHDQDGMVLYCDYCEHLVPAVWCGWRWHWYLGLIPIFPIRMSLCQDHAKTGSARRALGQPDEPRRQP
jgi:hypothetical protein